MKLIGIMSLSEDRATVRKLFENQGVQIFSETDILGHSRETLAKFGWFTTPQDVPDYSTLCFAIVPDESAKGVIDAIGALPGREESDHPVRGFVVPVETMI